MSIITPFHNKRHVERKKKRKVVCSMRVQNNNLELKLNLCVEVVCFFFLSFFSKQMCIYFLMFEVDDFQGVSFAKMCAGHYSKI